MPLIDIIIPAYNSHKTIGKTLASIAIQSMAADVRVTIVNDCGIGYGYFVDAFAPYFGVRELTLSENAGSGVARQHGVDNTDCPYIMFIDSDDTLEGIFAIKKLYEGIQGKWAADHHACVGIIAQRDKDDTSILIKGDITRIFGRIYTRAFLDKNKIRFNTSRSNEDVGYNMQVLCFSNEREKIHFIDDVIYNWQYNENSITRRDNCAFNHNEGFTGYVYNVMDGLMRVRAADPENVDLKNWVVHCMAQIYFFFAEGVHYAPQYNAQNFQWALQYYHELYLPVAADCDDDFIVSVFTETLSAKTKDFRRFIPRFTIYQFMAMMADGKPSPDVAKLIIK